METKRLQFITTRDGEEAAMQFAKTTYRTYKKAVLQSRKRGHTKPHFASTPDYREGFIRSCASFRQYIYPRRFATG